MLNTLKKALSYVLAHIPESLPVGGTHYRAWVNEIVDLAGPIADRDSLVFVISTTILGLPTTKDRKSKMFFVRVLRKAAANQVASFFINEIKEAQKARTETPAPSGDASGQQS